MMQSGRGPGLIGMFLALMVMLGFGLLFMFAFDDGLQGGGQTIQSVIAQQKKEIESLRQNISSTERMLARGEGLASIEKEFAAVKRESQGRTSNMNSLKMDSTSTNEAIATIEKEFEDYKNQYRTFVRTKAKGRIVGRLETRKGEVFENVVIREVTPIGMQIRHDGGLGRIPYENLPEAMQEEFQFDPDQKVAAFAKETAIRNEHETAVSASDVRVSQKAAEKKIKDAEDIREKALRAIAIKQAQISSLDEEIMNLEKEIPKEFRKRYGIGRAPIMQEELAGKKRDRAMLWEQINKLQNSL